MRRLYFSLVMLLSGLGLIVASWSNSRSIAADEKPAAALERAREQVKMLDDLYKNFVVSITATYVDATERTPAARVAMKVFQSMHKKGWHKARLVDATGDPVRKANLPSTPFEIKAIAQIKAGKPYYEETGVANGQPVLRAATVVPVVMKQCLACHTGKKEGDLLGAIVYEVPIK